MYLKVQQEYNCDARTLFSMMEQRTFMESLYSELDYSILALHIHPESLLNLAMRFAVSPAIPSVLKKFVPVKLHLAHEELWQHSSTGGYTATQQTVIEELRIQSQCRLSLEAIGHGRSILCKEFEAEIKIPFIGGKMGSFMQSEIEATEKRRQDFITQWVHRQNVLAHKDKERALSL